jgi:peptidoglycan hydrolase-like protein with peptidoglycan-binding domain
MFRMVVAIVAALICPTGPGIAQEASNAPPAAHKPLDMSAIPTLSPARVIQVQQALQRKGFDPGPIDGVPGPMTREAVRGYQDRYGMPATGEIDNQTLYALGGTELAGRPD